MKQFLVLLAVLPLLLVFFLQTAMDEVRSARISAVDGIVYAAKEQARQDGCFTEELKRSVKEEIGAVLSIDPSLVKIDATGEDDVKYRLYSLPGGGFERGLIHYRISVPAGQIMAGRNLFGIKEEDNSSVYVIENYIPSERLP